ncbi:MAG: hypothetical protein ACE5GE_06340 [Phycisphaerae bacterium]
MSSKPLGGTTRWTVLLIGTLGILFPQEAVRAQWVEGTPATPGTPDAAALPGTAQVPTPIPPAPAGVTPLTTITGVLMPAGEVAPFPFVDMYMICIDSPAAFSACTCAGPGCGPGAFAPFFTDTELWLFDAAGLGILANDDHPSVPCFPFLHAAITGPATDLTGAMVPAPGIYYLAITSYPNAPTSAGGPVFAIPPPFTEISGPDGIGGALPVTGWGPGPLSLAPTYTISLTGVSYPTGACCMPDASCAILSPRDCATAGGTFMGKGVPCTPSPCASACCAGDGSCTIADETTCTSGGGVYVPLTPACLPGACLAACCLESPPDPPDCITVSPDDCVLAGGTLGPLGTVCPTLSEEEATSSRHGFLTSIVCGFVPPRREARASSLAGPVDAWITPTSFNSHQDFGLLGAPPIPADFFGIGSAPFVGTMNMKGSALGFGAFPDADTIISRSADPFARADAPFGPPVTVDIEIIELSLKSVAPITVMINSVDTFWDVDVGLSDCVPPAGQLTAFKDHCNGGTYDSLLLVQPKYTFTNLANPADVRILDTGLDQTGQCPADPNNLNPVVFSSLPNSWVHDADRRLPLAIDFSSAFHPGLEPHTFACGDFDRNDQTDERDLAALQAAFGATVGDPNFNPQIDLDGDGSITVNDYREWMGCYRCFVGDPFAGPPVPNMPGDTDFDGDQDMRDFGAMQRCLASPDDLECLLRLDLDFDLNVNLNDFSLFGLDLQSVLPPGVPPKN